jgi:hypothetical protein
MTTNRSISVRRSQRRIRPILRSVARRENNRFKPVELYFWRTAIAGTETGSSS